MTAKKKHKKTNRTRAARELTRLEPSLTYARALHLLRDLVPVGDPVPDVTDGAVRADLLGRWHAKRPSAPAGSRSYAYLACYDGYSLDLVASDGAVQVHDLGSTEDAPAALGNLPATAEPGHLWFWFENQTYAADCYRAGVGVEVLSYDWSLLTADMRSRHADASYLQDRLDDARTDTARLSGTAPQVRDALLADAVDSVTALVHTGGTDEVRATASRWLATLTALRDDRSGPEAAACGAPTAAAEQDDEPSAGAGGDEDQPCEVADCPAPATACDCGAAHCRTHPHVAEQP